jgi:dienelactone hydrolase
MIWKGDSSRRVRIPVDRTEVEAELEFPEWPLGIVVFAHGSGSSRRSPRNRHVARMLREAGLATALVDLLTADEDRHESRRFDIPFLAERVGGITGWIRDAVAPSELRVGVFGASTGAAAALRASADGAGEVAAIVSRGGRPDLAGDALERVEAPTLLIVGSDDEPVTSFNLTAYAGLRAPKEITIIPGATHLFEEPGALDRVARLAADWFCRFLPVNPPEEPAGQ